MPNKRNADLYKIYINEQGEYKNIGFASNFTGNQPASVDLIYNGIGFEVHRQANQLFYLTMIQRWV